MLSNEFLGLANQVISEVTFDYSKQVMQGSSLNKFMRVGTDMENTKTVSSMHMQGNGGFIGEREQANELTREQGYEVTYATKTWGNDIILSQDLINKSKGNREYFKAAVQERAVQQIMDMKKGIETTGHLMLNEAFSGTDNVSAPDGLTIINAAHTWYSGSDTFSNLLTDSATPDIVAAAEVEEIGGAFLDSNGQIDPKTYDTIIVKKGSAAAAVAKKNFLFDSNSNVTKIGDVNIYQGQYTIIETPYITNANAARYFFLDSSDKPFTFEFHTMPEILNPEGTWDPVTRSLTFNAQTIFKMACDRTPGSILGK